MKSFFKYLEEIANAKNFSPENTFGYEELVANEYKILAVAWYPRDQWGQKLEKLKTAVGGIPFFNLGTKQKQSTFRNLAGEDVPGEGGWLMSTSKESESDYTKFKNEI